MFIARVVRVVVVPCQASQTRHIETHTTMCQSSCASTGLSSAASSKFDLDSHADLAPAIVEKDGSALPFDNVFYLFFFRGNWFSFLEKTYPIA